MNLENEFYLFWNQSFEKTNIKNYFSNLKIFSIFD
jgi:hypothetical protein